MTPTTKKKIKALGLNPDDFTTTSPENMEGRVVLADPKDFGKDKDRCLFKATGGFGCHLSARGSAVFVKRLCDGHTGRIERHDIIAVRTLEADEKAIKDRLEQLRGEINAERISSGEIVELQSLVKHIDPSDVQLLEWAGKAEGK